MGGPGIGVKLEILAEHAQKVFFQAHHQRMYPGVEQNVGALRPHLRGVAGGEVLHVHRRGDDGAGNAQPLGGVAFHLRAEHQVGDQLGDGGLDVQVIVGDQGLQAERLGGGAHVAGKFARVSAQADHLEAHFLGRHAGGGQAWVASPKINTRLPVR